MGKPKKNERDASETTGTGWGPCEAGGGARKLSKKKYRRTLLFLQTELVKLQKHLILNDRKLLIIFEGRDAAGKDGTIKRVVEHLSPRETRVFAPARPSDKDTRSWYFQRFVPHLPAGQEIVLFNRSWYNRAGVERVMRYCSYPEYIEFFVTVPEFENMLVRSGISLFKYYLDISKDEQARRLKARRENPLKQWKISPVDQEALVHWSDYSAARNEMFRRTHRPYAPWTVVRADNKRIARIQVIRHLLTRLEYEDKSRSVGPVDPTVVFTYDDVHLENGKIAE